MRRFPDPIKVEVRGKVYPSAKAAAKALGVTTSTVYNAMARGRTHTLGLGPGNRTNNRGGRQCKPVRLAGVTFRSQREASRALGFSPQYINTFLRFRTPGREATLQRAVMEFRAKLDMAAHRSAMKGGRHVG